MAHQMLTTLKPSRITLSRTDQAVTLVAQKAFELIKAFERKELTLDQAAQAWKASQEQLKSLGYKLILLNNDPFCVIVMQDRLASAELPQFCHCCTQVGVHRCCDRLFCREHYEVHRKEVHFA